MDDAQLAHEQRKTVSVVFADLVDSTSTAEQLDPEIWSSVLGRYFAALREAVERHGGTVEKFIGDAVVGVFGVPTLHEDDALRSVRAALDMQRAVKDVNAAIDPGLGVELSMRVGINTGHVMVSADKPFGHAISMAARLEQNAPVGAVLIGQETHTLVAQAVEAQPTDALSVKGSVQPLSAWLVTGLRETAARGSLAGGVYVGRTRELELIAAAFATALGKPACVTVTVAAPPGLGKSRLIAEATTRLADNARVLVGRCLPYGESITYAPLIEAVAQIEADAGPDAIATLVAGEADGEQVLGRIRATVEGAAHGSPDETAWAFRRLLETLAAQRPLVLILDDIHWADPLLLDLIEYVGTFALASPILILCAARPDLFDLRPSWSAPRENTMQVALAPLTTGETEGLLAALDGHGLDDATRRRIVETSAGVPLFLEQMAAYDAENKTTELVPPTIRALLAARVDQLAADDRALLQHAAIHGTTFTRSALAELMPERARSALGAKLMALVRRDFVRPERTAGGPDAFAFNHALIRDAIYEAMPRRLRAELHERYGDILSARGGVDGELIGFHLEQAYRERLRLGESGSSTADLARRAGLTLARAGRRALARKESHKAADLLGRAGDLLSADDSERILVLPSLIDALIAVPDVAAAEAIHVEAVALARSVGDEASELRAEIAWGLVESRRDATAWQARTMPVVDRAIAYFVHTDDHGSLARSLLLKALAVSQRDQAQSIELLQEAHAHALRSDDESIQVETWDELGGAMIFGPTPYGEALHFVRDEVAWARERGIAFAVADGRLGEAYAMAALGEFDGALAILRELIDLFAQLPGLVSQHGECYTLAGRIERDRGNPEAAVADYRRAMQLFDESGHQRWWRNAAPGVAHALLDLDRVAEARAVLDEIRARDDGPDAAPSAFRLEAEARYRMRVGEIEAALGLASRAVDAVANTGALLYEGRAREVLAGLLAAAGEGDKARDQYRLARMAYESKGYLPGMTRIDHALASN